MGLFCLGMVRPICGCNRSAKGLIDRGGFVNEHYLLPNPLHSRPFCEKLSAQRSFPAIGAERVQGKWFRGSHESAVLSGRGMMEVLTMRRFSKAWLRACCTGIAASVVGLAASASQAQTTGLGGCCFRPAGSNTTQCVVTTLQDCISRQGFFRGPGTN